MCPLFGAEGLEVPQKRPGEGALTGAGDFGEWGPMYGVWKLQVTSTGCNPVM